MINPGFNPRPTPFGGTRAGEARTSNEDRTSRTQSTTTTGNRGAPAADTFEPRLTPERKKALEKARAMLGRDKLGGADETFNHADVKPAVTALMKDKKGLEREIPKKLAAEGKTWEANIAKGALQGKSGFTYSIARGRIQKEAPAQIAEELSKKLSDNGIKPPARKTVDNVPRKLTFDDLRGFENASKTLQAMQNEVSKKTGSKVTFPDGISKAAIDHILNKKPGLPPGAVVKSR